MNDGQDPYGQDPYAQEPYGRQPQVYGYDAYGQPVYQPPQDASPEYGYDAYGRPVQSGDAAYSGQPGQSGDAMYPGQSGQSGDAAYSGQPGQSAPQPYDSAGASGWGDPQAGGTYGGQGYGGQSYGEQYGGQYPEQYGRQYGEPGPDPQRYPGPDPQQYPGPEAQRYPGPESGGSQQPGAPQQPGPPQAYHPQAGTPPQSPQAGPRQQTPARPQARPLTESAQERPTGPDRAPHGGPAAAAGSAAPGPAAPAPGAPAGRPTGAPGRPGVPGQRRQRGQRAGTGGPAPNPSAARRAADEEHQEPDGPYRTEQFSFLEEPDEESEDVIDWLKFAETRTERRDERRRKTRNRLIALAVVLLVVLTGGVGYLWVAGQLPGQSGGTGDEAGSGKGQKRDVIVLHLHETGGTGETSTVLLVDNETTEKGTAVLLPNALAVATEEGGSTTLGNSVEESSDATREALGTLLGADIAGTWRLDTPYLENLVELVDGITVDADTTVPAARKGADPLVTPGKGRALNGQAAVAYATYRAPAEPQTEQLDRFGQVMHAVLKKMSGDADDATGTVQSLAQIPDPSLSEQELGASLARLAERARNGAYDTTVLPVEQDGTLSEKATDHVVKDILGGTVKNTDPGGTARISVRNASGKPTAGSAAQIALINGGFTVLAAGDAGGTPQAESRVTYTDQAQAAQAKEVAKTLGLPAGAVAKGKGAANADVTVVLGQDYKGSAGPGGATGSGGTASGDAAATGGTASAGSTGGSGDVQGVSTGGTTGATG
ncbi:LytR C-terminal domain-containing protein [Streptomyces sp. NPDC018031]|uniref:LCP family protein n=1 Tax=Streptomyces sp. NPDC018031 TaxID=3365033 RepID=UPI0037A31008